MTAEIAIMNTQGIALAADSAVTLGGGSGKTYNSADKLFALSKYHPVGIMIYGSAGIMGIAWEIIIKSYRDFLGSKSFDKLTEYEGDFINYLSRFPYFTEAKMVDYLKSRCYDVFNNVLSWFLDDLHMEFDGKENIKLSKINSLFDTTLKNIKERMEQNEDQKQIKPDIGFIDSNAEAINEMMDMMFEKYQLSKKQRDELTDILKMDFKKCVWIDDYSGIVIAGYGEREIFPSTCDFKVSGKLGDSLIYFGNYVDLIGTDHTASICPYAQTEMVHQFVRGIALDFYDTIIEKFDTIMDALAPHIGDADKDKIKTISGLMDDYLGKISDTFYKNPIVDTVACMEKNELVSMAEAMVNLTALRRHISDDQETVGGPVDVALITKGDGFIWIKKKTTYDPNLNRELSQNYFRSYKNGNV